MNKKIKTSKIIMVGYEQQVYQGVDQGLDHPCHPLMKNSGHDHER